MRCADAGPLPTAKNAATPFVIGWSPEREDADERPQLVTPAEQVKAPRKRVRALRGARSTPSIDAARRARRRPQFNPLEVNYDFFAGGTITDCGPLTCESLYAEACAFAFSAFGFLASLLLLS